MKYISYIYTDKSNVRYKVVQNVINDGTKMNFTYYTKTLVDAIEDSLTFDKTPPKKLYLDGDVIGKKKLKIMGFAV